MDKQYRLPLVAMVETMKSSPQCVLLQAQLVSLPGVCKQACVAHVIVGQGALHACRITGVAGVLLQQRAAYEVLARYSAGLVIVWAVVLLLTLTIRCSVNLSMSNDLWLSLLAL